MIGETLCAFALGGVFGTVFYAWGTGALGSAPAICAVCALAARVHWEASGRENIVAFQL